MYKFLHAEVGLPALAGTLADGPAPTYLRLMEYHAQAIVRGFSP